MTTLQAHGVMPTLTANNLEQSIRFYTEGLGFVIEDRYEKDGQLNGVMLRAGDAQLGLSRDDFAKGRDRVKGIGMRLYMETEQDIPAIAAQAKAAGFRLDSEPTPLPWGPLAFAVTDPDGFKITIANPTKAEVP